MYFSRRSRCRSGEYCAGMAEISGIFRGCGFGCAAPVGAFATAVDSAAAASAAAAAAAAGLLVLSVRPPRDVLHIGRRDDAERDALHVLARVCHSNHAHVIMHGRHLALHQKIDPNGLVGIENVQRSALAVEAFDAERAREADVEAEFARMLLSSMPNANWRI